MRLPNRRAVGNQYELLARDYLVGQGLKLLESNFSTKFGELDLIMKHKQSYVFVEVKYRSSSQFGHAAEFVTSSKAKRMIKTAYIWLQKNKLSVNSTEYRFDVIAIENRGSDINWIQNAITEG